MKLSEQEFWNIKYYIEHDSGLNKQDLINMKDTIEAQQQEIEQLQAQAKVTRETLAKAREALDGIIKTYEDDFAIEGLEGLCPREDAILNYYARPALTAIEATD